MATDPLREELNKLALALEPHDIELIVGGGFGLVLRTEEIRLNNRRTRFQNPPGVRSTSDIDLFLRAEIVTDNNKMRLIRSTFDDLGYMKVKGAEYYQFVLPIEYAGFPRGIKVDLLAAPVSGPRSAEVKQDVRRIRPRGSFNRLHAHVTPEAFTVEQNTLPVDIGDASKPVTVHIPHPFSYLLLKLFALRDRIDDTEKGAYHAFDIYRTIAMMTSEEWDQALEMSRQHKTNEVFQKASGIRAQLFASVDSPGVVRVRQHALSVGEVVSMDNLRELVKDISELLSVL